MKYSNGHHGPAKIFRMYTRLSDLDRLCLPFLLVARRDDLNASRHQVSPRKRLKSQVLDDGAGQEALRALGSTESQPERGAKRLTRVLLSINSGPV